ncbi:MAG: translation initiation factor eIF-2B [Anaerolineales bacterium]|nr:translation initiation factor eIF-2B [Chloroflexota bacterium]MBL6982384.1 translation initiation factor eIF-2B [Anaerolineales bacterium]
MTIHPEIELVVDRIENDLIGGAADTAIEVMTAVAQLVSDSQVATLEDLYNEVDAAVLAILKVCPSFAPPINVLHMVMGSLEKDIEGETSLAEAKEHIAETQSSFNTLIKTAFEKISNIGAELIKDGDTVFMFSMTSSVWTVLRRAKEQGKTFTVLVTEARPANEGLWTVDEMHKSGIPVEVSIDACLAELIARSDIGFAGVDAIAADGSVFNKTGTYLSALAAKEYGVPFYFVSDTLKFDTATLLGLPFRSEPIKYHEVLNDKKYDSGVSVVGSLFDTTPPHLISAIVTELGPIPPSACINVMWNMKLSKRISELLPAWAANKL